MKRTFEIRLSVKTKQNRFQHQLVNIIFLTRECPKDVVYAWKKTLAFRRKIKLEQT